MFSLLPSQLWAALGTLRVHMYLGWVSVSWTERDRRARPEALLVHVLARPEDPRPGPPTPAPGAGGGGGRPAGGAPLRPHRRPLQVGPPSHPPGQRSIPAPHAGPFLTPASPLPSVQGLGGRAASSPPASAASSCGRREWWTSLRPRASSVRTGQPVHGGGGAWGETEAHVGCGAGGPTAHGRAGG